MVKLENHINFTFHNQMEQIFGKKKPIITSINLGILKNWLEKESLLVSKIWDIWCHNQEGLLLLVTIFSLELS